MTWLDILTLGLVGGGLVKGWLDGFVRQVAALGALLAAIFCCSRVALWLRAIVLSAGWVSEGSVTFVSYAGAFVLILAAVRLAGRWVDHKVDDSPLNIPNRLAGALCAAASSSRRRPRAARAPIPSFARLSQPSFRPSSSSGERNEPRGSILTDGSDQSLEASGQLGRRP